MNVSHRGRPCTGLLSMSIQSVPNLVRFAFIIVIRTPPVLPFASQADMIRCGRKMCRIGA